MGTRYQKGDKVEDDRFIYEVTQVINPESDSPDYRVVPIEGAGYKQPTTKKASDIRKTDNNQKIYYIEPYSFKDNTISREDILEQFPSLKPMFKAYDDKRVSGGNPLSPLSETGYRALAYTPPVKYAYYNEERDILVTDTEGDVKVVKNPSDEYLNDTLSYYPKAEVTGHGEKFDNRFDRN